MNRLKKIKELKELAEKYELENVAIIRRYTMAQLCKYYNGIGPDAFPEWLREKVTELHPSLEPAALIHDLEWTESDGSEEKFQASNERLERNGILLAKAIFPWYHYRRYLVIHQAKRFSQLCGLFGFAGWQELSGSKGEGADDCA